MNSFLPNVTILFLIIVFVGFFNEQVTHLTYEIALLLFSVLIGAVIAVIWAYSKDESVRSLVDTVQVFDIEKFLMKGVLCFMLFAGSRNLKLGDFKKDAKPVTVLSLLCTLLGAVFYGALFYLVSKALGFSFTLPMCMMAGSIVAPTDPIAATSILQKFGLPEEIDFLIEAESLFNDGVGVALFVCFSGMVTASSSAGFFTIMLREILGAFVVGVVTSWVAFRVILHTDDVHRRVFATILAVASAYLICERLDFSGAIASVICGITFSALRDRHSDRMSDMTGFDSFWDMIDVLLNSVLYVIMGLTFVRIIQMPRVAVLSLAAIILNFIARYGSVFVGSCMLHPLPAGYTRGRFSMLFTWGGLRGGLGIALAMSTVGMLSTDQYHIILGMVYAIVFFTTVIQGLSMKKVYEKISK